MAEVAGVVVPYARKYKLDLAIAQTFVRFEQRLPGPSAPCLDRAGAIVAIRDAALKVGIVKRMVLYMGGYALVVRI